MKNILVPLLFVLLSFSAFSQETISETLIIVSGNSVVKIDRTKFSYDEEARNYELISENINDNYTLKSEESDLVWKAAYKAGCKVTKDDFFELVSAGLESFALKINQDVKK